jgi:hypothetical protein
MIPPIVSAIPPRLDLGKSASTTMAHCMGQLRHFRDGEIETHGRRTVMGFVLPDWQRGLVWTKGQKISFIESAWLGIPLGTYSYNQADIGSPYDCLLIDGQQRMSAVEDYIEDRLRVFGLLFSEVPVREKRRWEMSTMFPCYITETENEDYLRNYYNLTNFGGTPHQPPNP